MPAAAALTVPLSLPSAVPSDDEIHAKFEAMLPELNSRASAISRSVTRDPNEQEEVSAELMAFSWRDFRQAGRRGKWLPAGQLMWFGWSWVRSGRTMAGGSQGDVLDPRARRNGRSRIVSIMPHLRRRNRREAVRVGSAGRQDAPDESRLAAALTTSERDDPGRRAQQRLDWRSFVETQDRRVRRILRMMSEGCQGREIARRLGLSNGRVSQLVHENIARAAAEFFNLDECGRELLS